MKESNNNLVLRPIIVKLVGKLLTPLVDAGVISASEYSIINSNLTYLSKRGELKPIIEPKLLTGQEVANILGISFSAFRAFLKDGTIKIPARRLGKKTLRYANKDVYDFIDEIPTAESAGDYELE